MMSAKLWAPALTACALATSIALVGCSKDPKGAEQAAAAQQMPPTEVGVIVAQPQSVEQTVELQVVHLHIKFQMSVLKTRQVVLS